MLNREELVNTAAGLDPTADTRLLRSCAVGSIHPSGQGLAKASTEADSLKGELIIQIREPTEISLP